MKIHRTVLSGVRKSQTFKLDNAVDAPLWIRAIRGRQNTKGFVDIVMVSGFGVGRCTALPGSLAVYTLDDAVEYGYESLYEQTRRWSSLISSCGDGTATV